MKSLGGREMKKLAKYALLAIMALVFSACSSVNHNLILGFDTNPKGAEIICDGQSIGFSPISYNQATGKWAVLDNKQYNKLKKDGGTKLPMCKAKWTSGYEDYYSAVAKADDFVFVKKDGKIKHYVFAQTLNRPNTKGYAVDTLAEKRYSKLNNAPRFSFKVNPKGAQIACDEINMADSIKTALQTGIFKIPKCKAVFISGYEQSFKDSINIDKQDLKTLFIQTINRPNTAGYDKDMQYALEVEKKEILEANERARTQAAQDQAWASFMGAMAAQQQANIAQQQLQQQQWDSINRQSQQYLPKPQQPVMCNTFGNITTCH